ncbi:MAG: hypothetical protein FJ096_06765 [Deltaproteobacteria bacterium]|nr:hypothetical protein [Deltaproteobacteria bacterium]
MTEGRRREWAWLRPYLVSLVPSALIGTIAITRILARAGEPAFSLDDSFIHLQYASQLTKGHGFEYTPGGGYSSGATSFAWPVAFIPFFWLGLRGLDLVWVAWAFGTLLHAAVAYETYRFGKRLLGGAAGLAAAAACSAFGAFAWFAWSGMETLALAWVLVRTARVASDHAERRDATRTGAFLQLGLLGLVSPLVRPEGALASAMVALVLLRDLHQGGLERRRRLGLGLALLASLAGPTLVPLAHRIGAGHAASSTAMVKHLAFDPYLDRAEVIEATLANVRLLVTHLLDGGEWTVEFLPAGFAWPLLGGLLALPLLARRTGLHFRAWMLLAFAAGTFCPSTYATLLWNRVRYLWPFAPAWFLLIGVLAVELGHRLSKRLPFAGIAEPTIGWGLVALLAAKLDGATADLANSARAISEQQVWLGKWAHDHIPEDALVGVSDTGAIAYLSERRTFDVVGLTTEGQAPYWAHGAGSRFEHWERRLASGATLPTHLILYRSWMGMPAVEGDFLTQATVRDQSILGDGTMTAMTADYTLFGSGERPFSEAEREPLGSLDVADVESERTHRFAVDGGRGHFCVAHVGSDHEGRPLADGGRIERYRDRFHLGERRPLRLVMRVAAPCELEVVADGERLGVARSHADGERFEERTIDLPSGADDLEIRCVERRRFTSYHYWWFAR